MHRKQAQAMQVLTDPKYSHIRELLYGGAKGGGKSFLGGFWLISSAFHYPGSSWFVARENLIDLRRHTIPTFYEVLKQAGVDSRHIKYNGQDSLFTFRNKSRILFVSAQYLPGDPFYERFGSMENTGGWIEEGGEVDRMAYENLKLSIGRCKNKEYDIPFKLLVTANPKKNWMRDRFIKAATDDSYYIQAFAKDNMYLPLEYQDTLNQITDKRDRQRLLLGSWDYDDDDNALCSFDKINDIFRNSFVPEGGQRIITSDIAITNDSFVTIAWEGMRILELSVMPNATTPVSTQSESGEWINKIDLSPLIREFDRLRQKYSIPMSNVIFDADGIGSKMKQYLEGAIGINNGHRPLAKLEYKNLSTELGYKLADEINNSEMFISCDVEHRIKQRIVDELQASLKRSSEVGEKLALVPKAEVKAVLGHSPDIYDAIKYRMLFRITRKF